MFNNQSADGPSRTVTRYSPDSPGKIGIDTNASLAFERKRQLKDPQEMGSAVILIAVMGGIVLISMVFGASILIQR